MSEHATPFGVPEWTKGDRLAKALHFAGIGIAEMADYLGVSRNTVGNYVNDRTRVPKPVLTLWAMRTGVPFEWLESGERQGPRPGGPDGGLDIECARDDSNVQPSDPKVLPLPVAA